MSRILELSREEQKTPVLFSPSARFSHRSAEPGQPGTTLQPSHVVHIESKSMFPLASPNQWLWPAELSFYTYYYFILGVVTTYSCPWILLKATLEIRQQSKTLAPSLPGVFWAPYAKLQHYLLYCQIVNHSSHRGRKKFTFHFATLFTAQMKKLKLRYWHRRKKRKKKKTCPSSFTDLVGKQRLKPIPDPKMPCASKKMIVWDSKCGTFILGVLPWEPSHHTVKSPSHMERPLWIWQSMVPAESSPVPSMDPPRDSNP